jgi:hypothetical protein
MGQKKVTKTNETTLANAVRFMFKNMKNRDIIYLAFSRVNFYILVFVMAMSIIVRIISVDLLLNIPTRVKKADISIYITRIVLSPAIVVEKMMKNVKNVLYGHVATYLLDVKYGYKTSDGMGASDPG